MPLFKRKKQNSPTIKWGEYMLSRIPPELMPLLEAVVQDEIRTHPKDVWDEEGKKQALVILFLILNKFVMDTILAKLPNAKTQQDYLRIVDEVDRGKTTGEVRDNFLRQYIPTLDQIYKNRTRIPKWSL